MAALAMGAAAFSSCSKGSGETTNRNLPADVRFTGGIGLGPATRAAGTAWAANDAIGIFMVEHGTATVSDGVANRRYTTPAGTSAFSSPVPADAIKFPTDPTAAVDFIAYYPHADGQALGTPVAVTVSTSQTTANQPGYDWLWASVDNSGAGYTNAFTGVVAFSFTHRLSKIVLNVTADPAIGALTGLTVKAKQLNTSGSINLATGEVSAPATPADIGMRVVTDGSAYDAIIIPATYAAGAATLEFTLGAKTYTCDLPAMTYAPANEYAWNVNIAPGGITITGTIQPWTPNNAGSLTAQ
jgi:hypothetical protein